MHGGSAGAYLLYGALQTLRGAGSAPKPVLVLHRSTHPVDLGGDWSILRGSRAAANAGAPDQF
jgi:hypothetical protein